MEEGILCRSVLCSVILGQKLGQFMSNMKPGVFWQGGKDIEGRLEPSVSLDPGKMGGFGDGHS